MKISLATIADAEEILVLQKLAYLSEAELYDDHEIAPLTQTLEEVMAQFEDHVVLKTVVDGRIVGTVRAREEDGTCQVHRLAVHPDMQNQGIGTALLQEIEKYSDCRRFELFTGSRSEKNIHLYEKLSYRVIGSTKGDRPQIEMVLMEKTV